MLNKQIEIGQNTKRLVFWIDSPDPIKEGYSITLKGKEGWWVIDKIHEVTIEKSEINRSWNVGGM